jgi:hypothetical protein
MQVSFGLFKQKITFKKKQLVDVITNSAVDSNSKQTPHSKQTPTSNTIFC